MTAYATVKVEIGGKEYDANLAAFYSQKNFLPPMGCFNGSPIEALNQIKFGTWHPATIKGVISAAIIGAGYSWLEIPEIVERHVSSRPIAESATLALKILASYIFGLAEEAEVAGAG